MKKYIALGIITLFLFLLISSINVMGENINLEFEDNSGNFNDSDKFAIWFVVFIGVIFMTTFIFYIISDKRKLSTKSKSIRDKEIFWEWIIFLGVIILAGTPLLHSAYWVGIDAMTPKECNNLHEDNLDKYLIEEWKVKGTIASIFYLYDTDVTRIYLKEDYKEYDQDRLPYYVEGDITDDFEKGDSVALEHKDGINCEIHSTMYYNIWFIFIAVIGCIVLVVGIIKQATASKGIKNDVPPPLILTSPIQHLEPIPPPDQVPMGGMEPPPPPPPILENVDQLIKDLKTQLKLLGDKFVWGEISESLYKEIRTEIENELSQLNDSHEQFN